MRTYALAQHADSPQQVIVHRPGFTAHPIKLQLVFLLQLVKRIVIAIR